MYLTSHNLVQPTNATLVYLWQVELQLRIMVKYEPWFKIYTDYINALQSIEEIGQLTLDHARDVGNTSEPAVGRAQKVGGR